MTGDSPLLSFFKRSDGGWHWQRVTLAIGASYFAYRGAWALFGPKGDPFKGNVQDPQDFSGFLRNPIDLPKPKKKKYDSTSFATFLKNADAADEEEEDEAVAADPLRSGLPDSGVPVCVVYGTEYGFSKEIAQKLCMRLKDIGGTIPKLLDMGDYPDGYDLAGEQCVFVVCSTHGDGVPPAEARDFVEWLDRAPALSATPFSVLALGDRNYEHYCACGKRIDVALEKLGGSRVVPRVDVDREDWVAVDGWIDGVVAAVPTLGLTPVENPYLNGKAEAAEGPKKRYGRSNPYVATVSARRGLCKVEGKDDKDTVMIEFDLGDSGLEYAPGDALGILPENDGSKVADLLAVWGVPAHTEVAAPQWDTAGQPGRKISLGEALTRCYDIRQPKPEIFADFLAALKSGGHAANGHANGHANGGATSKRLPAKDAIALATKLAANKDEAERYLEPRHLVDLFREFGALDVGTVIPRLRHLQPRLYSISSSMLESPMRVQCTIAVVRYESLGEERVGVCSTYCGERLEVGMKVPVYVSKNPDFRLPTDPSLPIVMVGPGTGLAPFRSFLKERTLSGKPFGPAALFFGCRRRDQDYLYGDLLEAWHREGVVHLVNAFSREGKEKVYVQHRLAQEADRVWKMLEEGGHFYVCGDASSMAGSVEKALLDIIATKSGKGAAFAKEYLDNMSSSARYQRDVWF